MQSKNSFKKNVLDRPKNQYSKGIEELYHVNIVFEKDRKKLLIVQMYKKASL